ncbi:unnamed protein product [Hydatigera taeniaeformis]|uniref:Activating signal cointegrator 1 n=1 Tax=Hydatigena taeniaeformis TaxID=6205 RepID=A0A0R3X6P3_HYDTA|nr:unnamed protein product [Hydatigera taeniaeformis]
MTKRTFVPLFTESGTGRSSAVLLPGRHPCQCLAVRHRLIGNCTNCGRIVCEQEGSGPCYFCGELVVSPEERQIIQTDTVSARKFRAKIMSNPWAPGTPTPPYVASRRPRKRYGKIRSRNPEDGVVDGYSTNSLENLDENEVTVELECDDNLPPDIDAQSRLEEGLIKAVIQRDRLLHFDATAVKRTRVIDDELDYFVSEGTGAGAVWLDPDTRTRIARRVEELREQRLLLRSQSAFGLSIDFNSMTITEQDLRKQMSGPTENDLAELTLQNQKQDNKSALGISDPLLNVPTPQVFMPQSLQMKITEKPVLRKGMQPGGRLESTRVQDADQQRLADRGLCLSLHQPWASLLVRGVKTTLIISFSLPSAENDFSHEGRSWYSAHRGPLWIAATAKTPDDEEVHAVEDFYLDRGSRKTDFPTTYPTGVLLGCLNVDDVLPQKEYRLKFPDGESESPYVFICSDPRELLIKLPMKGRQKIYRLEAHIHVAAKENLT